MPFDLHRDAYVSQWQRAAVDPQHDFSSDTSDSGGTYRLSRCVLLAHEDKLFQGALVASMSIPWGETKGDDDLGGYHLVWTRDQVQSATALLASGVWIPRSEPWFGSQSSSVQTGASPKIAGSTAPRFGRVFSSTKLQRRSCLPGASNVLGSISLIHG